MGLSLRAQEAVRREYVARQERHLTAWEEAKLARLRWRQEMLTAAITAEMLDISTRTLRRWVRAGRISCIRLGDEDQSPIRFRRADVEQLREKVLGFSSPSRPASRQPGRDSR